MDPYLKGGGAYSHISGMQQQHPVQPREHVIGRNTEATSTSSRSRILAEKFRAAPRHDLA